METRDTVVGLLRQVAPAGKLPADDESLFEAGYLDSFALPDLVAGLEKSFSMRIPDADLNPRKFETVEHIVRYVESKR